MLLLPPQSKNSYTGRNLYTGRRLTTILCTSVRKNNRESLTGDRRRGPRPLPSLRTPPSLPVPEHRDTALARASARENPSESPEHRRIRVSFFTQQCFCSGKGSLRLRQPAGTRPAGRAQGGAPPCRRAERRGCLPQDGGRQPGTARPRLGERGAAPQRKGGRKSVRRSLLSLLLLF